MKKKIALLVTFRNLFLELLVMFSLHAWKILNPSAWAKIGVLFIDLGHVDWTTDMWSHEKNFSLN